MKELEGQAAGALRALIEQIIADGTGHRVDLVFGARRESELYDLSALSQLAAHHPGLIVLPAVSEDPMYQGARGTAVDVALRFGIGVEHEVYVCGSADMVRTTVSRLTEAGVDARRIAFEDLTYWAASRDIPTASADAGRPA